MATKLKKKIKNYLEEQNIELPNLDDNDGNNLKPLFEFANIDDEDIKYDYLQKETIKTLIKKKKKALKQLQIDNLDEQMEKLESYRLINDIYEFHKNKFVIGINKTTKKMVYGNFIDIEYRDNGIFIYLLGGFNFDFKMTPKYDNFVFFQKMKEEEIIILLYK